MPGEPGDSTVGMQGSRKQRPQATVPPTEDVGEDGGQECKCEAQRQASGGPFCLAEGQRASHRQFQNTHHTAFHPPGLPPQSVQTEPLLLLASS